jgi:Fe-S cluster assembly iron-binding protein IscA
MVILTDQAAAAIKALTDQPEVPPDAGLRIAAEEGSGDRLAMQLMTGPNAGDEVVESQGAKLFLDPVAAVVLDGKALDAQSDGSGRISFTVENVLS